MLRTLRTPFILTVPLMLAGFAFAQKVQTDYDKSLDFSKFHTYAWREHPVLRNNPQIAETFSVALNLVRSQINRSTEPYSSTSLMAPTISLPGALSARSRSKMRKTVTSQSKKQFGRR